MIVNLLKNISPAGNSAQAAKIPPHRQAAKRYTQS